MEFDKRNPFAAWGYEQEKYTSDTAPKFESLLSMEDSAFVNDGAVTEKAGTYNFDEQLVFFTNNEHIAESLNIRRRKVDGKDIDVEIADNYNNAELNYYGIQPQDLMADTKAHAKSSEEPVLTGNEIWVKTTSGNEDAFIAALNGNTNQWFSTSGDECEFADPKTKQEDGYIKIQFTDNLASWKLASGDARVFTGTNVSEVILPSTLKAIADNSFKGFTSLTSVTIMATEPPTLGEDAFEGATELTKIYVPDESVDDYKAAESWDGFKNSIFPIGYEPEPEPEQEPESEQ